MDAHTLSRSTKNKCLIGAHLICMNFASSIQQALFRRGIPADEASRFSFCKYTEGKASISRVSSSVKHGRHYIMRILVFSSSPVSSSTVLAYPQTPVNTAKRKASATRAILYSSGLYQNRAAHNIVAAMFDSMWNHYPLWER